VVSVPANRCSSPPYLWCVLPRDRGGGCFSQPEEVRRFDRPLDRSEIIPHYRAEIEQHVGRSLCSPITDRKVDDIVTALHPIMAEPTLTGDDLTEVARTTIRKHIAPRVRTGSIYHPAESDLRGNGEMLQENHTNRRAEEARSTITPAECELRTLRAMSALRSSGIVTDAACASTARRTECDLLSEATFAALRRSCRFM
jgi:hypothetical protein